MSGISEERLKEMEMQLAEKHSPSSSRSYPISRTTCGELIAEIRRLRSENKELRDSYERVEKYAAELSRQREEQADMIRTINPLYR